MTKPREKTREECEAKLKALIAEMKAELAELKRQEAKDRRYHQGDTKSSRIYRETSRKNVPSVKQIYLQVVSSKAAVQRLRRYRQRIGGLRLKL